MKKFLFITLFTFFINDVYSQSLEIEVDNYIKSIAPTSKLSGKDIVEKCFEYNIDIIFVLAQGQIESHYGTTGTARKTNSVFNVGAYDGHSANKQNKNGFGFNDPNDSIEPYLILLTNEYLVNGKTEYDLMNNYVNYLGMRYASDNNYERMLKSIYNKIKKITNIYDLQYNIVFNRCYNVTNSWIY